MVILAVSVTLAFNIYQFSNYVDSVVENNLDAALSEIMGEITILKETAAHVASLYFSHDPYIVAAMEDGDHEMLMEHARHRFYEAGADFFTIMDQEGNVLARPYSPGGFGDDFMALRGIQLATQGAYASCAEVLPELGLAAVAISPIVFESGHFAGSVAVGYRLDTDDFVWRHKGISGCEISVYRGDSRVASTLVHEDGSAAVGLRASENIYQAIRSGEPFVGRDSVTDREMMVKYLPIHDFEGNLAGMLFAGHYLADSEEHVSRFLMTGLMVLAVFLLICITVILIISDRIAKPIDRRLNQVHFDALTGLYNRRYFNETTDLLIKTLSRSGGVLSMLIIDIDYFKNYNDTYGHDEGDKCLKIVAEALSKGLSRTGDFIVRYGGEEFVAVLPNTGETGARVIAGKMLENIRNRSVAHKSSDVAAYVTVSIGISTGRVHYTQSRDDYIIKADEMLYKAKQSGRNRYVFERP